MTAHSFALFDTAVGRCGIAWGARGIVGVQLPEASEGGTRAGILGRCQGRCPDADEAPPPPAVQHAIDGIVALLRSEDRDLSTIELDMDSVPPFHRRVYQLARTIAPGETMTYGEIAAHLGAAGSARAVGQALARNPFAIVVPCHRVLAAGGKVGGFSANGGTTTKLRLLSIERTHTGDAGTLFDTDHAYAFDPRVAVEHVRGSDAAIAGVIDAVGAFDLRLKTAPTTFGALAEAVVYQQLAGKAAATIFARVCALFPDAYGTLTPEQIMATPDDTLRAAGLSRAKLLSLRDLAGRAVAGQIPTLTELGRMRDEDIIEYLTEVRGIGRWTAQMLLIFRLGRPDVLPADDYGIRNGFMIVYKTPQLPTRNELERHSDRWKPYRTVASWYLWRAVDLAKEA